MKTNKFIIKTESDETLYECPECKHSFDSFTVIDDSRWRQIPKYCIYCGANMGTDVPFMKPGDEDDEDLIQDRVFVSHILDYITNTEESRLPISRLRQHRILC